MDEHLEANREAWDTWARCHRDSEFYDLAGFARGGIRLDPVEVEEMGDVVGKSLLHVQCHIGTDSLSWARLGADVTGVDFSPESIAVARELTESCELARSCERGARFVLSDVYGLPDVLDGEYDVVYTAKGVLPWLPDLERWAAVVARFLRPGGVFYLYETNPLQYALEDQGDERELKFAYPYFTPDEPDRFQDAGSYASADAPETVRYEWGHGLGEIVTALIEAGLRIEFVHEFPFTFFKALPFMEHDGTSGWRLPDDMPEIPLSFSLRAVRDRHA